MVFGVDKKVAKVRTDLHDALMARAGTLLQRPNGEFHAQARALVLCDIAEIIKALGVPSEEEK